jgi:hypothetical protein
MKTWNLQIYPPNCDPLSKTILRRPIDLNSLDNQVSSSSFVPSKNIEFLEIPSVAEQESLEVLEEAQRKVKQHIAQVIASYQRTTAESDALKKEIAMLEEEQEAPFADVTFKSHSFKSKGNTN